MTQLPKRAHMNCSRKKFYKSQPIGVPYVFNSNRW
jgi:hypothetical protein